MAADLVDVEQMVRRLNSDHPGLANLEPLARFLLRAEAVASSNIEGLLMNVRRLARSEAAQRDGLEVSDATARAVLGNIRALDETLELASDPTRAVRIEDLTTIHRALLAGTREEPWAGVVGTEQNWIGGVNPCAAAFVPPASRAGRGPAPRPVSLGSCKPKPDIPYSIGAPRPSCPRRATNVRRIFHFATAQTL